MRVVVTGLGCITPIGNTVDEFWNSLVNGNHGFIPITKFNTSGMKVKIAAEVKNFKPENYIEKVEIRKTDLYAQYALAAAAQAVKDSDIKNNVSPERIGVYVGSGIGGMGTFISQTETILKKGASKVSPHFIPMIISNIASALISIKYKAEGPNLPVVSACASSTNSIGEAFRAIKYGYADIIIAGGAEATINSLALAGFTNCLALSTSNDPDNCSLPFDKRREGFVMGEGAGIIILEELEHAKKRGAKIYCEIVGYGNTCDAFHITAPNPEATSAARMITQTLKESHTEFKAENLYVNAHGTGTLLNDKTETNAIKMALPDPYGVSISSTKSMTGHMLGAAGAVEAIASIKTIQNGIVPPTIGLQEFDPDCDLNYVPRVAIKKDINIALSLSMGFGGHNAGILLIRYDK